MNTLFISNEKLYSFEITKVKPWKIYFDYDEKHYMIHGEKEVGEPVSVSLYERIIDEKGHWELEHINSVLMSSEYVGNYYFNMTSGMTYNQLDIKRFIVMMQNDALVTYDDSEVILCF